MIELEFCWYHQGGGGNLDMIQLELVLSSSV